MNSSHSSGIQEVESSAPEVPLNRHNRSGGSGENSTSKRRTKGLKKSLQMQMTSEKTNVQEQPLPFICIYAREEKMEDTKENEKTCKCAFKSTDCSLLSSASLPQFVNSEFSSKHPVQPVGSPSIVPATSSTGVHASTGASSTGVADMSTAVSPSTVFGTTFARAADTCLLPSPAAVANPVSRLWYLQQIHNLEQQMKQQDEEHRREIEKLVTSFHIHLALAGRESGSSGKTLKELQLLFTPRRLSSSSSRSNTSRSSLGAAPRGDNFADPSTPTAAGTAETAAAGEFETAALCERAATANGGIVDRRASELVKLARASQASAAYNGKATRALRCATADSEAGAEGGEATIAPAAGVCSEKEASAREKQQASFLKVKEEELSACIRSRKSRETVTTFHTKKPSFWRKHPSRALTRSSLATCFSSSSLFHRSNTRKLLSLYNTRLKPQQKHPEQPESETQPYRQSQLSQSICSFSVLTNDQFDVPSTTIGGCWRCRKYPPPPPAAATAVGVSTASFNSFLSLRRHRRRCHSLPSGVSLHSAYFSPTDFSANSDERQQQPQTSRHKDSEHFTWVGHRLQQQQPQQSQQRQNREPQIEQMQQPMGTRAAAPLSSYTARGPAICEERAAEGSPTEAAASGTTNRISVDLATFSEKTHAAAVRKPLGNKESAMKDGGIDAAGDTNASTLTAAPMEVAAENKVIVDANELFLCCSSVATAAAVPAAMEASASASGRRRSPAAAAALGKRENERAKAANHLATAAAAATLVTKAEGLQQRKVEEMQQQQLLHEEVGQQRLRELLEVSAQEQPQSRPEEEDRERWVVLERKNELKTVKKHVNEEEDETGEGNTEEQAKEDERFEGEGKETGGDDEGWVICHSLLPKLLQQEISFVRCRHCGDQLAADLFLKHLPKCRLRKYSSNFIQQLLQHQQQQQQKRRRQRRQGVGQQQHTPQQSNTLKLASGDLGHIYPRGRNSNNSNSEQWTAKVPPPNMSRHTFFSLPLSLPSLTSFLPAHPAVSSSMNSSSSSRSSSCESRRSDTTFYSIPDTSSLPLSTLPPKTNRLAARLASADRGGIGDPAAAADPPPAALPEAISTVAATAAPTEGAQVCFQGCSSQQQSHA